MFNTPWTGFVVHWCGDSSSHKGLYGANWSGRLYKFLMLVMSLNLKFIFWPSFFPPYLIIMLEIRNFSPNSSPIMCPLSIRWWMKNYLLLYSTIQLMDAASVGIQIGSQILGSLAFLLLVMCSLTWWHKLYSFVSSLSQLKFLNEWILISVSQLLMPGNLFCRVRDVFWLPMNGCELRNVKMCMPLVIALL